MTSRTLSARPRPPKAEAEIDDTASEAPVVSEAAPAPAKGQNLQDQ